MVEGLSIEEPREYEHLVEAYWAFLRDMGENHDLAPTLENAQYIVQHNLIPAAERGEPVLIAYLGETIIGATFTTLPPPELEFRRKFAFGHGTWVTEYFRRRGVAAALMEAVRVRLCELGVEVQRGQAALTNRVSLKTFERLGFVPYALVLDHQL